MTTFLLVRNLYGVSQQEVAKETGITQRTYATYDSGKTKKVPYDFVKKFARHYMVDEAWLLGSGVVDRSSSISQAIGDNIPKAAERLHLPEAFLKAVCSGAVAHSDELYRMVVRELGVAKETAIAIDEAGNQKELTIQDLLETIQEKDKTIKNLNAYISLLEAKIRGYEDYRD